MPHIAHGHERHAGKVVGNGHCAVFVRECAGLPATRYWREGGSVLDALEGTAIATFDPDGRYGNHEDGRSHAAILIAVHGDGLFVWDQYRSRPGGVAKRLIRFRGGAGKPCDDGDAYSAIELTDDG